jgi:transcriptional regulator with XRE-family HTH domain
MAKIVLEEVLKSKKLSKRQFAKKLGIIYSNVFRLFRADCNPRFSTLEEWAKVLGVKVTDLIRD